MIYHITQASAWSEALEIGAYQAESLETEGFIHCSSLAQVLPVANAFYQAVPDLVLLCIDETKLTSKVIREAPAHIDPEVADEIDDSQLFPHVYGVIQPEAVVKVVVLPRNEMGVFQLPTELL